MSIERGQVRRVTRRKSIDLDKLFVDKDDEIVIDYVGETRIRFTYRRWGHLYQFRNLEANRAQVEQFTEVIEG